MHNKGVSFFNFDFANRTLEQFDCNRCFHVIRNKSINQHRAEDCDSKRNKNQQSALNMIKVIKRTPLKLFDSQAIIEKCENEKKKQIQELEEAKKRHFNISDEVHCPICLESTQDSKKEEIENGKVSFVCENGHQMHSECLLGMIKFEVKKCPVCRQNVQQKLYAWLSNNEDSKK